ncbi:MAG: pilus assembly protein PilM [Oscillospiraceae bacterium]|nr:pilus assembly protein PilM [Oscillospiraceae bacterium]
MAKTILGVDIGSDSLKLALVAGKIVKKVVAVPMPHSLVKEGRVVSIDAMGDLISSTMRENDIHCTEGAMVLPDEVAYVRNVVMHRMTTEQLDTNLPYEFRDYISEDLSNFYYDYALLDAVEEPKSAAKPKKKKSKKSKEDDPLGMGDGMSETEPVEEEAPAPVPTLPTEEEDGMHLMAAAVPRAVIEDARNMFHKAGMTLVKAAPAVCSFIPLIRSAEEASGESGEYCLLDLGYKSIRMYMFRGDRYIVTRELETGLSFLDEVIAEAYGVDAHLAHTYLLTNYDECQSKEYCQNAYNNIAVELMRALNFYRFSNQDSQLSDVWLCGGGAMIAPLRDAITETLDLQIHQASELLPGGKIAKKGNITVQASGIAMY